MDWKGKGRAVGRRSPDGDGSRGKGVCRVRSMRKSDRVNENGSLKGGRGRMWADCRSRGERKSREFG